MPDMALSPALSIMVQLSTKPVELHAETSNGVGMNALHGFILFGDWSQAMGYLGTPAQ